MVPEGWENQSRLRVQGLAGGSCGVSVVGDCASVGFKTTSWEWRLHIYASWSEGREQAKADS